MCDLLSANNFQACHIATSLFLKGQISVVACGPAALLQAVALVYESAQKRAYQSAFKISVETFDDLADTCFKLSKFYRNCLVKCRLFATSEDTKFSDELVQALKKSGFASNELVIADTSRKDVKCSLQTEVKEWIKETTDGLISNFDVSFGKRNTIVTVVCFQSTWKSLFSKSFTQDRKFTKINGDICTVKTMFKKHRNATVERFYCDEHDISLNKQVNAMHSNDLKKLDFRDEKTALVPALRLTLPLIDGSQVMFAYPESAFHSRDEVLRILPAIAHRIGTKETCTVYGSGESVSVRIPKMNIVSNANILEANNIIDNNYSFKVLAALQVNETGVRAAASSVVAYDYSGKLKKIYFNRPFVFAVASKEGVISFCGYYNA